MTYENQILLIDGHFLAYRAFYGMNSLKTSTGEPIGAVYGFARKLFSVIQEYQPQYLAVAFDLSGTTWRHVKYPEYKANRNPMPNEMQPQIAHIENFLHAFNVPIFTSPDNEADDVLGTLSRLAPQQKDGLEVLILTGDRDLFQLINDQVKVLYIAGGSNSRTSLYGPAEVVARYEITPQQLIDLKALTGDSSDNIPGVPGVGEKTAIKFLKSYETLDGVYENVQLISGPKTRQNLIDAQEQVLLNTQLMTILTGLELRWDINACRLSDYDQNKLIKFLQELECHRLIEDLPKAQLSYMKERTYKNDK